MREKVLSQQDIKGSWWVLREQARKVHIWPAPRMTTATYARLVPSTFPISFCPFIFLCLLLSVLLSISDPVLSFV